MDRIILGDNPFFGVNHASEEKARASELRFRDTRAILRVLGAAHDLGIRQFMCTTHDRMGEIVDAVRAEPSRWARFEFLPCMPYAHKYANSVSLVGIFETIKRFSAGSVLSTLYRGAVGTLTRDIFELM